MTIGTRVGTNLRRIRNERNISLSELSRRSGIAKATLSTLESGIGNPTVQTLSELSDALGIMPGDLIADRTPRLVRAADSEVIESDATRGRLVTRINASAVDAYEVTFLHEVPHLSVLHVPGAWENVYVISGRLHFAFGEEELVLESGDSIQYPLEEGVSITALDGNAQTLLLMSFNSRDHGGVPGSLFDVIRNHSAS